MKTLKYLALIGLVLFGLTDASAQLKTRFATNVRYIAGGYIDKRPQFNTLEAALNDVIAYATVNNPYVFWIDSDTLQIADWDSVFTESGLTMKDSINNYYVDEGKIKWAGFGFGGGSSGGGGTVIPTQTQTTTHYSYPNWDQSNSALSLWIRNLAKGIDSVDQHIWDLIVYTDSTYLYIEDDTLKLRTSTITALVNSLTNRPDTTIIAYKTLTQTISGDWTIDGDLSIGAGSLRLPTANNRTSTSRILWSSGNRPYYSGSGAVGDSVRLAAINLDTDQLEDNDVVGYNNIDDATIDSLDNKAWLFAYNNETDPDTITIAGTGIAYTFNKFSGRTYKGTVSDSTLVPVEAGTYEIDAHYDVDVTGSMTVEVHVFVNDVEDDALGALQDFAATAGNESGGITGVVTLSASDVIKLKITSDSGTGTAIVGHVGIRLVKLADF